MLTGLFQNLYEGLKNRHFLLIDRIWNKNCISTRCWLLRPLQNVFVGICPLSFLRSCSSSPPPKHLPLSLLVLQGGVNPSLHCLHGRTAADCQQSFHTAKSQRHRLVLRNRRTPEILTGNFKWLNLSKVLLTSFTRVWPTYLTRIMKSDSSLSILPIFFSPLKLNSNSYIFYIWV